MNRRTVPSVVAAVVVLSSFVGVAPTFAQNNAPNSTPVSLTGQGADSKVSVSLGLTLEYVVHEMLEKAGVSYILPAFTTMGTVKLHDVPFPTALAQVLGAAIPPMTYRIENSIYIIYPKVMETPAPAPVTPPTVAEGRTSDKTADPVLAALEIQAAQMEIKRAGLLIDNPPQSVALVRHDAEMSALRRVIERRRVYLSTIAVPERLVADLQQNRIALLDEGYTPSSDVVQGLNRRIDKLKAEITAAQRRLADAK